ncbi:LexA family protein [Shewanella fodinae]|uniref:LexA family protein n=1 Tax=Shewanella fodinae TaxID=552357 RepID=UPI001673B273|nr:translesion error-prone DNA polymerase V autoproteolytic subunit [Shewanella fodinae]MCL2905910.1 translesion error-prone DNA polymerase V autoproteolytic subunit [Shewanella fodinae]GGY95066.1 DNA polymerase V [Shewanella fodinae]
MRVIPIYASAGITGFESPAAEYHQLPLSLDELLVEHPSATFFCQASGDSMQGVGIFDGDVLIVDRHITMINGDVIVANINGEFVCKCIDTTRKLLLSANEAYQPVPVSEFDTFSVEGVVIRSIHNFRPNRLLRHK